MMKKPRDLSVSKWTRTPEDPVYSGELLLPSFGIRLTRSDPVAETVPAGRGTADIAPQSGDAFSVSYQGKKGEVFIANQEFLYLDPGYLRRVLLQILDREEYHEVMDHHLAQDPHSSKVELSEEGEVLRIEDNKDVDLTAQVRITDLRLAKDILHLGGYPIKDRGP